MGWVFRVFQWQKRSLRLSLLKYLVIPLLEYCCQLWNPWKANDIQAIEAIQRTYKITEIQHLNYWERLHELKLYSLQGHRERCRIKYIFGIYMYMVPNIDGTVGHQIKARKHPRHGTQWVINYPRNRNPVQSLRENTISVFGPRLYNSMPKYLKDIESVKTEKFKFELDKFLELIPDELKMPNYVTAARSNSIAWPESHLRAQKFTKVGSPRTSMEQAKLLRNHSKYPSIAADAATSWWGQENWLQSIPYPLQQCYLN